MESDPIGLKGGINTYAYVGNAPLVFQDSVGLMPNPAEGACVLGPNPICIGGLAADLGTWALGGVAAAGIFSMSGDSHVNDPQAQAEHDAYKQRYNEPPPPFKDPCEELRWRLKREEDLLRARQAWDAKWLPGRHAGMNGEIQSKTAIRKLQRKDEAEGM